MNKFVFVVCGSREHIETLNFSLNYIRFFSRYPIIVVTDTKRNEVPIVHDTILDISTPAEFDNHQASIYLKTGLHKFLDFSGDGIYCYLDSDIVAIEEKINTIFAEFRGHILFAKDHCKIDEFSPYAMNCSCLGVTLRKNHEYMKVINFFEEKFLNKIEGNNADKLKLDKQFGDLKKPCLKNLSSVTLYLLKRYVLPTKELHFGQYIFNKSDRYWYNSSGKIIHFDYRYYAKAIYENTGISYNKKTNAWFNKNGENITPVTANCKHLSEYIKSNYGVFIPDNWQHWNGGVFLFDKSSNEFLDYWHNITIAEFQNPYTKTRDQGTLAISAWKFGLQNCELLPCEYNLIAEYENPQILYSEEKGFTVDGFETTIKPCFLHIYHEWGHVGWSIWDYIIDIGKQNNLIK